MAIKVGFIGVGNIAGLHLKNLKVLNRVSFEAFCDVSSEHLKKVVDEYGGRPYSDYKKMLDKEKLDAVFLCTPHTVRAEPIEAIAKKGVALFCEKPPEFTVADARRAVKAVEKTGIITSVGLMYRWANISDKIKSLVAGRPLSVCRITGLWQCLYWGLPPWLYLKDKMGGIIAEQGIHLIDTARYITGDEVVEVQAFGGNRIVPKTKKITIEDTVSVNFKFASGAVGSHVHSWSHRGWIFRIELAGESFYLVWDIPTGRVYGTVDEVEVNYESSSDKSNGFYTAELTGFLDAVEMGNGSLVRSTYADAVRSMCVTLAALKSVDSGKVEKVEYV